MSLELKIYRNQLKLEIDTETRKSGLFQVTDNSENLLEAQIGNEFSDKTYFERKCKQGVDALLDVLHKFVVSCNEEEFLDSSGDNVNEDNKYWSIVLNLDSRRSVVTTALASVCHKYIAYNMLYSWAVMTMPNLVEEYKDQRAATLIDIQRIVYRKETPTLTLTGEELTEDDNTYEETLNAVKTSVESHDTKIASLEIERPYFVNACDLFGIAASEFSVQSIEQNGTYNYEQDTDAKWGAVAYYARIGRPIVINVKSRDSVEGNAFASVTYETSYVSHATDTYGSECSLGIYFIWCGKLVSLIINGTNITVSVS